MVTWLSIVAVLAVVFLGWNLYRRFGSDRIAELNDGRRATSRLVSRGEFVDGNRHLEVALALTAETFFYENSDMQASLDLEWLREVEYDNELGTGGQVHGGQVLRLRSNSQTFEFVIPNEDVAQWRAMLPPSGRADKAAEAAASAVAVPVVSAT